MHTVKFALLAALAVVSLSSMLWSQDACDLAGPPNGSYLTPDGYKIRPTAEVTFTIHLRVATATVGSVTNAFEVYISDQPNGVTQLNPGPGFRPITFDTIVYMRQWFDGDFAFGQYSVDGLGADTAKFSGFTLFKPGIPVGTDRDVYEISTGNLAAAGNQGYYLCIDSCWAPPGATWLWTTNSGNVYPHWGGPYCYEIKSCCTGSEGDVDGDGGVNVGDLSVLVAYVFPPHGALPCDGAGNVDGQSAGGSPINVADITYIVAFLFQGGPAPVACGS